MSIAIFLGLLMLLFMLGLPVAFAMGLSSVVFLVFQAGGLDFNYGPIAQMTVSGLNNFVVLAIPLFLLAGKLMNTGGITKRIFRFARALVGFLPGGLGHVNIVSSMIFAGMSGTAVSDAAGLGTVEIKAMKDAGYDNEFSAAVTAASSTIGPIIPPSLPMVMYGAMGGVSVGALFLAGMVPGVVMGLSMMALVWVYSLRRKYPRDPFPGLRELAVAFGQSFLPMLTPVIIVGGIWLGVFTPTEAAAVAVVYALVLGLFIYRELKLPDLYCVLKETVRDTAALGVILAFATFYGHVLMRSKLPITLLEMITSWTDSPVVLLLILNGFLLVVGAFMETISAITILVPILQPVLIAMGIDLVHFGVIMVLNLMIGLLTPPFGIVLFVISRIAEVPLARMIKLIIPWVGALIAVLLLITLVPEIVTFIPRLLVK